MRVLKCVGATVLLISFMMMTLVYGDNTRVYQANNDVSFRIVNKIERKDKYFTQGLSFLDSETLLESTGQYGSSDIHILSYPDLKIKKQFKLENKYFGEGSEEMTIDGVINYFMLTWKEKKIF